MGFSIFLPPPATPHSNVTTNPDTHCVLHVCDIGMGGAGAKKGKNPLDFCQICTLYFRQGPDNFHTQHLLAVKIDDSNRPLPQ